MLSCISSKTFILHFAFLLLIMIIIIVIVKIIVIIIFVYLIADIPSNLKLLTSTTQGGTHNSRHAGQRYIHEG